MPKCNSNVLLLLHFGCCCYISLLLLLHFVDVSFRHSCLPVFAWGRVVLHIYTRNNYCEFLTTYGVNILSVIQSCLKKQFVVFYCHTLYTLLISCRILLSVMALYISVAVFKAALYLINLTVFHPSRYFLSSKKCFLNVTYLHSAFNDDPQMTSITIFFFLVYFFQTYSLIKTIRPSYVNY